MAENPSIRHQIACAGDVGCYPCFLPLSYCSSGYIDIDNDQEMLPINDCSWGYTNEHLNKT